MIEQVRLLTLKAAWMMDTVGNKVAKTEIAMIKITAPRVACQIVDWAMQAFGGTSTGTGTDYFLPAAYAMARALRLADGPDEVHRNQLGRMEVARHAATDAKRSGCETQVLSQADVEREFAYQRPDSAEFLWRSEAGTSRSRCSRPVGSKCAGGPVRNFVC